jgi:hypothetical protein
MGHWLQPFLHNVIGLVDPATSVTLKSGWQSAQDAMNQIGAEALRWQEAIRQFEPPANAAALFRSSLDR